MKPHKHAELIKAWADGAEIEKNNGLGHWVEVKNPDWMDWEIYRIKPEVVKLPEKVTLYIYNNTKDGRTWMDVYPNEMLYPDWQYMGSFEVLK